MKMFLKTLNTIKFLALAVEVEFRLLLTSGRIDVNLEPSFRGDDSVIVIVVEIGDVVTVGMIQTQLAKCD
jgi:hypothetical protein